ncbi:uncharacterized protein EMH_0049700 [Eimeria mitis]|uniref:Protein kinase domain-containing protein n=1 Tax=Eimeria mitis TaxID=44415 RepID=U6JZG0_9EIME|nr:uncharacterized protein EMH_0049700 [Eimeria mitis]CDJ29442.1 hypothetical protein EMH_0049700 [Eimeria mitis]
MAAGNATSQAATTTTAAAAAAAAAADELLDIRFATNRLQWYRAPELILLAENYTEAIDVWSIGCIFSELLSMIEENVESHCDRGPLFPGSSCFPLSPDQKNGDDSRLQTRGNKDQLNVIFNVLGTPTEEEIEALESNEAKQYIRTFPPKEAHDLAERFSASSPEALNLLKRMLVFNPKRRISVDECLAHPFFKEVRNPAIEVTANEKVRLPFNDWANMDEPQLRSSSGSSNSSSNAAAEDPFREGEDVLLKAFSPPLQPRRLLLLLLLYSAAAAAAAATAAAATAAAAVAAAAPAAAAAALVGFSAAAWRPVWRCKADYGKCDQDVHGVGSRVYSSLYI